MNKGCPKCGRMISDETKKCPFCGYEVAKLEEYYADMSVEKFDKVGRYAGVIKRIVAFLTDSVFISLLIMCFIILSKNILNLTLFNYFLISIVLLFVYKIFSEAIFSKTIGKKIVGIEIINAEDSRISFAQSIVRNVNIILDVLTLGIGFVMIGFNEKKKALHDFITNTEVINSYEEVAVDTYVPGAIRLIAFCIDLSLIYGFIYLIEIIFIYIKTYFNINLIGVFYNIELLLVVIIILIYFGIFETGVRGASLGKKILGIKIAKIDGKRMGFLFAVTRCISIVLEILTLGFSLCLVTNKRQTLKDKIFSTKVIRR